MNDREQVLLKIAEAIKAQLLNLQESGLYYVSKDQENNGDAMVNDSTLVTLIDTLQGVREEIGDCTRCKLCEGRQNIVFGSGNPQAQLVFVGEGPGADEDLKGEPFVGRAGQLLTKMIEAMGLGRDEVYICNVVKCRPPKNRDPEPDEIAACEPFLKKQLSCIKPRIIVGLGRYACQTLLQTNTPMSKIRGIWHEYEGIQFMPTFHPAYLLRNPPAKKEVWQDLQQVMAQLKVV